jgi:syndetin
MCGIYLKMMHHLPHIAWDVFLLLVKLLEFNVYAVFVSFVEPEHAQLFLHGQLPDNPSWDVLLSNIVRISEDFSSGEVMLRSYVASSAPPSGDRDIVTLRRVTRLPTAMDNACEANSYAFAERAVAAASIVSQTMLLQALKPLVQSHVAERYEPLMEEVYTRCEQSALQLRGFIYSALASVALASDPSSQGLPIAAMVAQVKWGDITYLSDRPNDYVVHIVRKCGEVWGGMQIYSDGAIPAGARDDVWAALVQHVMDAMLAGVMGVSRCTPHGRALMTMDLLALQNGLDLINHVSRQRVPRGCDHVNDYVKAFYLSEDELLEWIRRHKHAYTKPALASLIRHGVGSAMAKKELRDLVLRIDAILSTP